MNKILGFAAVSIALTLLVSCSVESPPQKKGKVAPAKPMSKNTLFADTLGAHNRVRTKHKLPSLKWSNDLANISQKWANTLGSGKSCKMYHHSGNVPFGENLYRSGASTTFGIGQINRVTITNVVKAWMDEEKFYDYKNNRCQPGQQCGHYTQAVWKGTKEVGCAMKVCDDKSQVWVCSYFPAGNITGARPY